MWVNNLPKVATQWNSGTTRDSNPGHRARIPSALTTRPLGHTTNHIMVVAVLVFAETPDEPITLQHEVSVEHKHFGIRFRFLFVLPDYFIIIIYAQAENGLTGTVNNKTKNSINVKYKWWETERDYCMDCWTFIGFFTLVIFIFCFFVC